MTTLRPSHSALLVRLSLGTVARRAQALLNVDIPDFRIYKSRSDTSAHLLRDVGANPQCAPRLPGEMLVF
jgi:hypothetical protein